jgi:TetR/AcrR family transcriptional repressor of nem operon
MAPSEKARATRMRILSAATELFYLNGYHATGLDKVIRLAGVTKGNFYYHFKSKEELAVATLEWQFKQLSEDVTEQVLGKRKTPLETLFLLFDYMVRRQKEQHHEGQIRGCYFGNFALEFSTVSSSVRKVVDGIFDSYRAMIESLLAGARKGGEIGREVNVQQFAKVVLGQIEGAILLDKAQQQPDNFEAGIQFIKQYLLKTAEQRRKQ